MQTSHFLEAKNIFQRIERLGRIIGMYKKDTDIKWKINKLHFLIENVADEERDAEVNNLVIKFYNDILDLTAKRLEDAQKEFAAI